MCSKQAPALGRALFRFGFALSVWVPRKLINMLMQYEMLFGLLSRIIFYFLFPQGLMHPTYLTCFTDTVHEEKKNIFRKPRLLNAQFKNLDLSPFYYTGLQKQKTFFKLSMFFSAELRPFCTAEPKNDIHLNQVGFFMQIWFWKIRSSG